MLYENNNACYVAEAMAKQLEETSYARGFWGGVIATTIAIVTCKVMKKMNNKDDKKSKTE